MEYFLNIIVLSNRVLSNKRTRHIAGGVMLSVSMFFVGLALTVVTMNEEEEDE
jgi:hypothetical protein